MSDSKVPYEMSDQYTEISHPLAKIAAAWTAVGISSWSDASAFMAFCLTAWILGEKIWKAAIRPYLVNNGYLSADRRKPRPDDTPT